MAARLIAVCGLIAGSSGISARIGGPKLLRYYWFRLSDAMVPLALAFWLMAISSGTDRRSSRNDRDCAGRSTCLATLLVAVVVFGWSCYQRNRLGSLHRPVIGCSVFI